MLSTRTPSEVLRDGLALAVRYGAPLETQARLLKAADAADRREPILPEACKVETLPVLVEVEAE